jgi:hypothetical protein
VECAQQENSRAELTGSNLIPNLTEATAVENS